MSRESCDGVQSPLVVNRCRNRSRSWLVSVVAAVGLGLSHQSIPVSVSVSQSVLIDVDVAIGFGHSRSQSSILNFRIFQASGTLTVHHRKHALTIDDLHVVVNHYSSSILHDDLLFVAMLIMGFFGLLHLGEMTFPDNTSLQNLMKVTRCNTVIVQDQLYLFTLPGHKADHFFEGNKIIIPAHRFGHNPLCHFMAYLSSCDRVHPVASPLWLTEAGTVSTCSFFINRLRLFFEKDITGQSMGADDATALPKHVLRL